MASLVWGAGLLAARGRGVLPAGWCAADSEPIEPASAPEASAKRDADPRRRHRTPRGNSTRPSPRATGEATHGDDLGLGEARDLDLERAGGEEQLLDREIEQAFNQNFAQVRRCLVLVDSDQPVRGTLTFGLRIAGQKGVTRVNLNGPSAVTSGEAGDCLRKAARGIRLRTFDGPDMVVHYPLVLN